MDWPGKVSTNLETCSGVTPSVRKIPMQTPIRSSLLDVGGVIGDVHEGGVHHLVVDGVLGGSTHSSCSGVKIVDEEAAHFPLFNDICSFSLQWWRWRLPLICVEVKDELQNDYEAGSKERWKMTYRVEIKVGEDHPLNC
ncbi:hypothetical protein Ccrd_014683 [Cynara cardunculus var. scolymus]|uniref:Uncharacterized protein n=1 Tax=Cynara cardunculus var. scolymus TaxID=59895 RepID=A0A124SGN3_CYNCS|nr:hypothetical protein Ccrd_014683 [Cynara cardunculus var. scolymus]